MQSTETWNTEVAVVGGGPAGLTAAIALAGAGVETVLIAPPHAPDTRTTALLAGSVKALEALAVWSGCHERAAPLKAIRLVDDRGGLLRAPEVTFQADEIGLEAFGYNVPNRDLLEALINRAAALPTLRIAASVATGIDIADAGVILDLENGACVHARLAIGADGRNSLCRRSARIGAEEWSYPQTALTCNLTHGRSHQNVSTEFHTAAGPFTLVPLPGLSASLVWVTMPAEAARLHALGDAELSATIERHSHSVLGKVQVAGARGLFPLSGMSAQRFAGNRVVLIGEAAHVIPPIGAQGFNLGLRDAATIAELVVDARRRDDDVGASEATDRYNELRRADIGSRAVAVDLLNRSLLSDFLPLQGLRGLGLYLADKVAPLRQAIMREGVAPRLNEPQLMRGEPLR